MSYQPLARKYRPSRFNELVGQDGVAMALANAIRLGREPHGVIFSGVRGIGKTTTARLYAKALNCVQGPTAEPCNECESCLAITKGAHEDVLEIDGASNTGVADVRALQETIGYIPQRSKYKVYIIDEVHMLSGAAWNALLKTLEEPPAHVVFVFATTELHKVPQTIVSRCQTFFLQKLSLATICAQLASILQKEGIAYEDEALAVIAREAHGSMRDGLTLLDQAIALGEGKVTYEVLSHFVSNLSSAPYLDLLGALIDRDGERALSIVAELDQAGAEFDSVCEDTAKLARHGFVIRDLGKKALDVALLGLTGDEVTHLEDLASRAAPFDLNRVFRTLVKCRTELDGSALDRYVFENYLMEWCFDPGLPRPEALLQGGDSPVVSDRKGGAKEASDRPSVGSGGRGASLKSKDGGRGASSMKDVLSQIKRDSGKPQFKGALSGAPQAAAGSTNTAGAVQAGPVMVKPPLMKEQRPATGASGSPCSEVPSNVADMSATAVPSATPLQNVPEMPLSVWSDGGGKFPETWRALVDKWKRKKPLQARKLEDVHCLTYGETEIVLAVSEDSFATKSLLQAEEQRRIREQFGELFSFNGTLKVLAKSQVLRELERGEAEPAVSNQEAPSSPAASDPEPVRAVPDGPVAKDDSGVSDSADWNGTMTAQESRSDGEELLPETLLSIRQREAVERLEKLRAEARNAPFTKEVLAVFGGSIEDIRVNDGS